MATAEVPKNSTEGREALLEPWLNRLAELIGRVEEWGREFDWSTRRIEKTIEDSRTGDYKAPALLLQKETTRVLLEPIARSSPGTEGVVDLYQMPAYDDVASLYYYDGGWQLHAPFSASPGDTSLREAGHRLLSREVLRDALLECSDTRPAVSH